MIKFRLCTIITVAGVIDNELVFKFQLAEKSTWRNGKSLHLSKTNYTQVKDHSIMAALKLSVASLNFMDVHWTFANASWTFTTS